MHVFHILPAPDEQWEIKEEGYAIPLARCDAKEEAIALAMHQAQRLGIAQVIIHRQDFQIEEQRVFDDAGHELVM